MCGLTPVTEPAGKESRFLGYDRTYLESFSRERLAELDQRVDRELANEVRTKKEAIERTRQRRIKKALKKRRRSSGGR